MLAAGGFVAQRQWAKHAGPMNAAILGAVYYGAFGVSHPLAKRIGPWPAVLTVAAVSAAAAWALRDVGAEPSPCGDPVPQLRYAGSPRAGDDADADGRTMGA